MEDTAMPHTSMETKSLGAALWERIRAAVSGVKIQRQPRRLRLCETLSLGEKRFVALIECEGQRYLVAATAHNISLLPTGTIPREGDERRSA